MLGLFAAQYSLSFVHIVGTLTWPLIFSTDFLELAQSTGMELAQSTGMELAQSTGMELAQSTGMELAQSTGMSVGSMRALGVE
jgi:hypothetical protein